MRIIVPILKKNILLLIFCCFACSSNKSSKTNPTYTFTDKTIKTEIGFVAHNSPYDFLYTDGIYDNGKGINKFEKYYQEPIQWDNFTLDFDFFTSKKREQWPIMMGTATRSIGFLLKKDMTIEITANNQKQVFPTRGLYETNRWYHVKIVKLNNNTEVYLDETKIGEFQIQIEDNAKNYPQNNISSVNYSNGIAFDGGLRNIIYVKKGDFDFSKKIHEIFASNYKDKNSIFLKNKNVFRETLEYKLLDLNWKSFKIEFEFIHTNDETKLTLGKKWKIIDFHTINDTVSISVNNNRISFLSGVKLEPNQLYNAEILINDNILQMMIDGEIVLDTKFEYYNKKILDSENEIFVVSKVQKPTAIFKSLAIQNNVPPKIVKNPCTAVEKKNSTIDILNEGALEALFIPPFEYTIKANDTNEEFAFTKSISGFNTNSFEMTFDFLTNKKEEQDLIALGVYTKYSEIDLSIVNNELVFKTNNKKSTVIPVNSNKITRNWNNCKIVYDNGLLNIYLNKNKIHEINYKFSDQFYKSKLLTIKNTFEGSFKNLYVYESAK